MNLPFLMTLTGYEVMLPVFADVEGMKFVFNMS